ncbi:hypothetical protein ACF0H5_006032 [Mactra antiquata]
MGDKKKKADEEVAAADKRVVEDQDVDSGYAWVILTGCFIMYLFVVGSIKAYGVLYAEMLEYFNAGSGNTAWIGSICFLIMLGIGPFSNLLCRKYSFRIVTFIGGISLGLGYFLSGFVPRTEYMYLTFGLVSGVGYGLSFAPCSTIISFYFAKHRALANGITVSASGIGAVVFPFFYRFLIDTFSLPGTFWIMGAITSNVCVAACLFRQPKLLVKEKQRLQAAKKRKSDQKALLNGDTSKNKTGERDSKEQTSVGLNLRFSLFKNPLFTLYAVAFTLCMNGYGNNIILIPSHVRALGYDKLHVTLSVVIMGGCETVSRILFGWLADQEIVKRRTIFLFSMFISAIFAFIAPFFDSFIYMAIYAAIIGIFPGSFWSLMSVILIEVVGMEDFTAAFGLVSMCLAIGAGILTPIVGWLTDIYGSWHPAFYWTGCILLLSGLILLLEPLLKHFCMKPEPTAADLDMVDGTPIRRKPKRVPPIKEETGSLLDEDLDVSFTSNRISKIYRPYKPSSEPESPQRTSAPIVTDSEI